MKKLTTDEFIEKSIRIHGKIYDYKLVNYVNTSTKVSIICETHGVFDQIANTHLSGKGCKKCSIINRSDRWNESEDEYLKNNYHLGKHHCADKLNKTFRAVRDRSRILGLTKKISPRLQHPHINSAIWANLIRGAKERNLEVTISFDDIWEMYIKQNKKCKLTGWDIKYSKVSGKTTASVDRIDSKKGYTLNNIQIIHKHVNKSKQNFSDEYFFKICKSISNFRNHDLNPKLNPKIEWVANDWHDTEFPELVYDGEYTVPNKWDYTELFVH